MRSNQLRFSHYWNKPLYCTFEAKMIQFPFHLMWPVNQNDSENTPHTDDYSVVSAWHLGLFGEKALFLPCRKLLLVLGGFKWPFANSRGSLFPLSTVESTVTVESEIEGDIFTCLSAPQPSLHQRTLKQPFSFYAIFSKMCGCLKMNIKYWIWIYKWKLTNMQC